LNWAEKVTTSKQKHFQVRLNSGWQVAIKRSDTDWQRALEQLERVLHQVTPAKRKVFHHLFQHHQRQLLPNVRTNATCPRSISGKKFAQMKTGADEEAYWTVNSNTDKRVKFQVCLSHVEIKATCRRMADMDSVVSQLEGEFDGICS
jgi:hypothetical protein